MRTPPRAVAAAMLMLPPDKRDFSELDDATRMLAEAHISAALERGTWPWIWKLNRCNNGAERLAVFNQVPYELREQVSAQFKQQRPSERVQANGKRR